MRGVTVRCFARIGVESYGGVSVRLGSEARSLQGLAQVLLKNVGFGMF